MKKNSVPSGELFELDGLEPLIGTQVCRMARTGIATLVEGRECLSYLLKPTTGEEKKGG